MGPRPRGDLRTLPAMPHPARLLVIAGVVALGLLLPEAALAHAELVSATPAHGAVLTEPPTEIVLTYSQGLDEGSSIVLKDGAGSTIATATPASVGVTEMRATFAPLAPGTYTIESTTKSSEDGEIDRAIVTFEVAAPSPTPPTATPEPSGAPSAAPSPTPAASPTPAPTGGQSTAGGSGGMDALLPIAIVGLLIGGGLALLLRRPSRA